MLTLLDTAAFIHVPTVLHHFVGPWTFLHFRNPIHNPSGLEMREYGRRDPSRGTNYPQNLVLSSSTSGGRSVDIVRSRTQATEPVFVLFLEYTGPPL
jgi:hypothetical protein